ncbi:hypothetical protein H0H81_006803 [Sphagnurus paluster]|uniref:Uncharacterized protein n=1 Tax=Sphagnurus paluster TaxID=117069 RepID=A0A9P7GJU4_9AGAR|nr:hypothetical protein H0H81_006803 [Sphagnurus paluster]
MTEYDFSPEAYEHHMKKQRKIGRWVDDTNRAWPNLGDPFQPATPAAGLLVELPPDRAARKAERERTREQKKDREKDRDKSRHRDKDRDRDRDRHRDADRDRSRDRDRDRGRDEHYHSHRERDREPTYRSTSHGRSSTQSQARPAPARHHTVNVPPVPTAPPLRARRASYDHYNYAPTIAPPPPQQQPTWKPQVDLRPAVHIPTQNPNVYYTHATGPGPGPMPPIPMHPPEPKYLPRAPLPASMQVAPHSAPAAYGPGFVQPIPPTASFIGGPGYVLINSNSRPVIPPPSSPRPAKQPPLLKRLLTGLTGSKKGQKSPESEAQLQYKRGGSLDREMFIGMEDRPRSGLLRKSEREGAKVRRRKSQ